MSELRTVEQMDIVCAQLIKERNAIEKETAEKCAQIAIDSITTCAEPKNRAYYISRTIQETFGVNV